MNPRKPAIAFASSSSASITSSSGAQGSEDFRLHVAVKRLIGRRCLPHQAWRRLSGVAVAWTRAAATYHVLLFLAAGCARARAPALWSWRRGAAGGGAGDLLRLLLRQYVEESFGARPERSRRVPRLLLRQYVQESFGAPGGHG